MRACGSTRKQRATHGVSWFDTWLMSICCISRTASASPVATAMDAASEESAVSNVTCDPSCERGEPGACGDGAARAWCVRVCDDVSGACARGACGRGMHARVVRVAKTCANGGGGGDALTCRVWKRACGVCVARERAAACRACACDEVVSVARGHACGEGGVRRSAVCVVVVCVARARARGEACAVSA